MKKVACALTLLAMAVFATADVQIFFTTATPSPWTSAAVPPNFNFGPPANVFLPSAGHGTDYGVWFDDQGEPPITYWNQGDGYVPAVGNFPIAFNANTDVNPGDTAYIWIKFNIDNVNGPQMGAKLQGLDLIFQDTAANPVTPDDIGYYMFDGSNAGATAPYNLFRWDGDPGAGYSNFKKAHQVLVAVTSNGIRAANGSVAANGYRYRSTGTMGVALLGAVKMTAAGTYTYSLGAQGINFNTGANVSPATSFGTLTVIPEPAAVLLLGLAGLLLRRR